MSWRLPRDISGATLAKLLERFGYVLTRQKGSHIRLTTHEGGEHSITVPNHSSLRLGTLNSVLRDVADHARVTRDDVAERLFG
jgi:predicted RNA binding protein YcfA (HicA-like mRNA interferase family)